MKTWTETPTLAALAVLFTLPLAACTERGPDVAAAPDAEPGDPAVYAPDGWPLQIGDRVSNEEVSRLRYEFRLPLGPLVERLNPHARSPIPIWTELAMNLVNGRVYAGLIEYDPTKVGDYDRVYRGHFRIRFEEWMRHYEPELPPEFHGKVEYYPRPPPYRPPPGTPLGHYVYDPSMWDADGRRLKLDPDWVPLYPPNRLEWPDYPEARLYPNAKGLLRERRK